MDQAALDALIMEAAPAVTYIAHRIHRMFSPGLLELKDLVSMGYLGLVKASKDFDPAKGASFFIYSRYRVRGEILDGIREVCGPKREDQKHHKVYSQAKNELQAELGEQPTDEEIAERLGIDSDVLRSRVQNYNAGMMMKQSSSEMVSFRDQQRQSPRGVEILARSRELSPEDAAERSIMASRVKQAGETILNEREQRMVELLYSKGRTMKQIAAEFGVNESRVSQIHKAILKKMRVYMTATTR